MGPYDHLMALYPHPTCSSLAPERDPVTKRVRHVVDCLERAGVEPEMEVFPARHHPGRSYINVFAKFRGSSVRETRVIAAHHDVNNPRSENCQDNTASVAHLLALADTLAKEPSNAHTVLLAFVDAEEVVDPIHSGAGRLADRVKSAEIPDVSHILNLELTANGRHYWFEDGNGHAAPTAAFANRVVPGIFKTTTPYNDSFAFRARGLSSICLGSLDDANFSELRRTGFCGTWALCHQMEDTIARSARSPDMAAFGEVVKALATAHA